MASSCNSNSLELSCIGCGCDLVQRFTKKLGEDSKASNYETCKRVLTTWKELVSLDEHHLRLFSTDSCELKMCRQCFGNYDRLAKLWATITQKLQAAVSRFSSSPPLSDLTRKRQMKCDSLVPSKRLKLSNGKSLASLPESLDSDDPPVTVVVGHKSGAKRYHLLIPHRRRICKALARGHHKSLVDQCFTDDQIRQYILNKMSRIICSEMKTLCSTKVDSVLKRQTIEALQHFNWDVLLLEIREHAPILTTIFLACTKTRQVKPNRNAIIGMCIAMLLKFRYDQMSLVHKIIALILYAGHSNKQVYERLQKLYITLSHKSTIRLVKMLGEDHDACVKNWRDSFLPSLSVEEETTTRNQDMPFIMESDVFGSNSDDSSSDSSSTLSESDVDDDQVSEEENDYDYSSSDESISDETEITHVQGIPLVAEHPSVLEPSVPIITSPGLPLLSRHEGFRLCGDNIDGTIRRRHMRSDKSNISLHYFHSFAVANRIDVSELSDERVDHANVTASDVHSIAKSLLPNQLDDTTMVANISVLISRTLCTHLTFFQGFSDVVDWHIRHKYYKEMAKKSHVVPLGIIFKNEAKGGDMVDILTHLHQYVPSVSFKEDVEIASTGEQVQVNKARIHPILVGGDQMTAARSRSAIKAKSNGESPLTRLDGIIPVVEDWHTKANFLGLIWKYYYSIKSSAQHGTLYQLRNYINRTNVVKTPIDSFDACEDFFILVVESHIAVAAMTLMEMTSVDDIPSSKYVPDGKDTLMKSKEERRRILDRIVRDLVNTYVSVCYNIPTHTVGSTSDQIHSYARRIISIGCFYLEFRDALKEGDGIRTLRCYRYMLPMFSSSGRNNYAIESCNLLLQHDYILSAREAEELLWSRFINVHGQPGKNIPNDLHCEHLNRLCKTAIRGLGPNKTDECIARVSKALGTIYPVLENFDMDNGIATCSGAHRIRSSERDMKMVIGDLLKTNVFKETPGRRHATFNNPRDPLHATSYMEMVGWIMQHINFE